MPNPTPQSLHLDGPLTDLATAIVQDVDRFVADDIFPSKDVDSESNEYHTFVSEDWFLDDAKLREFPGESAGTSYRTSSARFDIEIFSVHFDITKKMAKNADAVFTKELKGTEIVTMRLLLRSEIRWAAKYFAASIWDTDLNGGGVDFVSWNDALGLPLTDVLEGRETMNAATGVYPQILALGANVYVAVRLNPQVKGQLQPTSPQIATLDDLANFMELEKVMKLTGVKNTANQAAVAAMSLIHGDSALLAHRADDVTDDMVATAGLTFVWREMAGPGKGGIGIEKFPIIEQGIESRVEATTADDQSLVAPSLGIFFDDPLAP